MISQSSRKGKKIEWIVVHYPVAPGKDADWCVKFYNDTKEDKSAHFAVSADKTNWIVQCDKAAHHCATYNRKTYCDATNLNSIGIDLMDNKINRKSCKVEDDDWYIDERTLDRAAELIAFLMRQYNIPLSNVVRHYDVTHKWCPRPLMGDDINKYYGISGNERWKRFKEDVGQIYKRQYEVK